MGIYLYKRANFKHHIPEKLNIPKYKYSILY